jgi:hypothetical protein
MVENHLIAISEREFIDNDFKSLEVVLRSHIKPEKAF